jgi:hypothetical protein
VQPAGAPVLFTLTVHNTGREPISFWWSRPGGYPDANDFFAVISRRGELQSFLPIPLSNGQTWGAGHARDVPAGHSVSFPAVLTPLPAGAYSISVKGQPDGRMENGVVRFITWPALLSEKLIGVEIRDDEKLLAARDAQVLAKVRANDPLAKFIASRWPRKPIRDALIEDLMGENIVQADRAAEGLWGDNAAPAEDAPIIARAILKHLKPPEGVCDVGLMEKLLRGTYRPDSVELRHALVRLAAVRPGTRSRELAMSMFVLPDRPPAPIIIYDTDFFPVRANHRVQRTRGDVATLDAILALATSPDASERKTAFGLIEDYVDEPRAVRAIQVGLTDTDAWVKSAALEAFEKTGPFKPEFRLDHDVPQPIRTPKALAQIDSLQIETAIEKAQQYLLRKQLPDGSWETIDQKTANAGGALNNPDGHPWGSKTAAAVYALLESGKRSDDPVMRPAIKFLLSAPVESTSGLGFSSQIAGYLPAVQSRSMVKRNVAMLLGGMIQPSVKQIKEPENWTTDIGFYGYWTGTGGPNAVAQWKPQPWGYYDRSNSAGAVCGMAALEQSGGEVPNLYWQIVDTAWKKAQLLDGSWNFHTNLPSTADITAVGVATLLTTQNYTLDDNWSVCKGAIAAPEIEHGLQWLDQNIGATIEQADPYTLYCIARAGLSSGRTMFGSVKWFEAGAARLLATQADDGSWAGHDPVKETALALLFLSTCRHSIAINKLAYNISKAPDGAWNERPRDVANLVDWMGQDQRKPFSWRMVTLQSPRSELDQAPVLYISGSEQLNFSRDDIATMKGYVNRGGILLGNADCGKEKFSKSFLKLGNEMFPEFEFRQLPPNDPLFNGVAGNVRRIPKVMVLGNGKRNLMVLVPDADLGRAWQMRLFGTHDDLFRLGANVIKR